MLIGLATWRRRPFVCCGGLAQNATFALCHLHGHWQAIALCADDVFADVGVLIHPELVVDLSKHQQDGDQN